MAHIGSGIGGETKKKEAYDNFPEPNLSSLPNELVLRILKFLPFSNLDIIILVNKRFNDLGSDPILWKRFPIQAMDIAQVLGLDILLNVIRLPRFRKLATLDSHLRKILNWPEHKLEMLIKTLKLYESYQTLDTSGKRIQGKIKRGEKLK